MQQQQIKISKLKNNTGQIPGLPKNPRTIKGESYKTLLKSIQDDPELLELRELIVYPFENIFVVIAGNQRLRACRELKYKELTCKVLPVETSIEKLKAITIKDNVSAGIWSDLGEWDSLQLLDWGLSFEPEKVTTSVNFEATNPKPIILTVEFDSLASQEVLYERLKNEGFNCWIGKKKPKQ